MKFAVFLAVAFVIFVNIVGMIYRRDMPNQVVIKDYDYSNAKEGNTVIRVNDKTVYRKIIDQYFPSSNE